MSNEEYNIRQDEHRKSQINLLLKSKLGNNITKGQVEYDSWWTRLMQSPGNTNPGTLDKLKVIVDNVESYPSFFRILFCSLDYSLVQLYILIFFEFELIWGGDGNPLLSLFIVYLVEKFLRHIRASLGAKNLCNKTHVDSRFLV